jgi:hypothetical protein
MDTVDTFRRVLLDFEREKHAKRRADDAGGSKSVAIDHSLAVELGLEVPAVNTGDEAAFSNPQLSFPQLFVSRFFDEWRARCMARFSCSNTADYLMIDRDLVIRLLNEVELAARRDGLLATLTDYVERSHQYKSDDRRSWIWRQTSVVTAHFNAFIERGGCIDTGSSGLTVTKLNGDRALVFQPMNEVFGEFEVPEVQADFSDRYLMDWIQALQHSIRSNAVFQAGITSDVESNRALGRVLVDLEALLAAEVCR